MRRLRLGMVGGGQGAFIGGVHRFAARIDNRWELVAGALSSDPIRARVSGAELGLDPARSYADFLTMAHAEAARPDGIDAVSIVTPNHMHAAPAIAFLEAGIHVICDKPLAGTEEDAKSIADAVRRSGKHFILTHNYTGYPLIRQAREMVASGELGALRVIQVEYAQDWLTEKSEGKQAAWRADTTRSGKGGAIADIGTHAFNLASFVTGQMPRYLAADLSAFVPGRPVDDNAHILLRYTSGARGMLWASQVAVGKENALRLRIYGDKASLEWDQKNPNQMAFTRFSQPRQILTRGGAGASEAATAVSRLPAGHPEGYLEGFATLYREAADLISNEHGVERPLLLPDINEGLYGVRFISACIASAESDASWVRL